MALMVPATGSHDHDDDDHDRDNASTLDLLYLEHADRCYRFALRIVRDRDLAHDVVQEVFEALVRQPERFRAELGSQLGWLLTLTHHKAVDLVRWHQRHARLDSGDHALAELLDPAPTPEDAAGVTDDRERVLAALQQLRPGEREVLVLAHFGGYSQHEIAERTGLPLGTVKGRTRSAMRWMRVFLAVG
jgi:RNA polymerase sigma-70 factor (ECF subfamily)